MMQDEVGYNDHAAVRLERTMRKYVFLLPLFIAVYGYLISQHVLPGSLFFSNTALVLVIASTTILALYQIFVGIRTKKERIAIALSYHVIFDVSLLYVYGVLSPIILAWLLLVVITMTVFGKKWAYLSYCLLFFLMSVSLALTHASSPQLIAQYGISAILMGGIMLVFSSLISLEHNQQEKLTEAKARQNDQRDALLTIINGTNQAIFTVSSGGLIRIYNSALLSLIDTNKSLSGLKVDEIFVLHDKDGNPVSLYRLMKDSSHFERDDLTLRFSEGDEMRLHLSVNKIQSAFSSDHRNDGEGYVCIARDVTKQKSLEEERDEFVSVVSHELRTPVTIAEGTISNVQFFLEHGADPARLVPSLKEAHEQILLLANMINDLGTLSRAERGVGDLNEVVDVKELVESLYKSYGQAASKKGLIFNLDLGTRLGTVTTSRLYLEEMLQNFITNAIKYTKEGSVTLMVHKKAGGIEFAVKDTGIGISKSDTKHIFEKFYRSEDFRTRETAGTGLGLYVVTKLMHKLGTKVNVQSRLNHGSTFSFVLSQTEKKTKD